MQVSKWGNSLAIRLPADLARDLGLKEGDELTMHQVGKKSFLVEREMTREEAVQELRNAGRPLPKGFRFNRLEAHAR